jgi:hypothetical protein
MSRHNGHGCTAADRRGDVDATISLTKRKDCERATVYNLYADMIAHQRSNVLRPATLATRPTAPQQPRHTPNRPAYSGAHIGPHSGARDAVEWRRACI